MIDSVAYLSMHTSPLAQPGTGHAGGMNVYIDELSKTMAGRGVDVAVFTRRSDPQQPELVERRPGYRVVHIPAGQPAELDLETLPGLVTDFAAGVVGWLRREHFEPDVLHSHYWLSGWSGVLAKEATGVPLINSFHTLGRVKERAARSDESPTPPARALTEDQVLTRSDAIVASTPYEVDDLVAHYGADPHRVHRSPPGVNHGVFRPGDRAAARRRLGLGEQPLLLAAGRIDPHKGLDTAVRALAKLPDRLAAGAGRPHLLVVGGPSGPRGAREMQFLHKLAAQCGVDDRVHFIGALPHERLADYYRAADVLTMPSRSESFGMVAAEAQACGLPVVASDVGGLRYVVRHGVSGLISPSLETADFADALVRVLDDPDARSLLSAGARAHAAKFSWDATARRLLGLYASRRTA